MQYTLFIERTHSIECSPLDTLASGDAEHIIYRENTFY
jgi:hypothetical protein